MDNIYPLISLLLLVPQHISKDLGWHLYKCAREGNIRNSHPSKRIVNFSIGFALTTVVISDKFRVTISNVTLLCSQYLYMYNVTLCAGSNYYIIMNFNQIYHLHYHVLFQNNPCEVNICGFILYFLHSNASSDDL